MNSVCDESTEPYAIEPGSLTVSGISAGGAMATQFHVAFSKDVNGVGIFAGSKLTFHHCFLFQLETLKVKLINKSFLKYCLQVPYGCAKGTLAGALNCMNSPFLTSVPTLITRTDKYAQSGTIDPTSNMAGDKVYVFHGTRDTTVNNKNGEQIVTFYENYLTPSDIKTEFTIAAEHCQVKNLKPFENQS